MNTEGKQLLSRIQSLIRSSRQIAAQGVNTLQVMTNYEIGRLIVEHEQRGRKRAEYGQQVIRELSDELSLEFGTGFSKSNLEYMRRFFLEYKGRHFYGFVRQPRTLEEMQSQFCRTVEEAGRKVERFLCVKIIRETAPYESQVALDAKIV